MRTDKILAYAGLAAAKRCAVFGTDLVLKEIRKTKPPYCVILANDASERTVKQITDKCTFYSVLLIKLPCDMETLSKRVGKTSPTACVAVTDKGLAEQIVKCSTDE